MKKLELDRTLETNITPLQTAKYHINPENSGYIAQILRNMYSEPWRAVVREYLSNAVDAHQNIGCDAAIEIHLPTTDECWFGIRDFGPGMDTDAFVTNLCGYGSSGAEKRGSVTQIGGFGIGAKSAFAVCDQFTYTVIHGGRRRVWQCFLDEHDDGQAKLLVDTESADPTGVEVRIPVPLVKPNSWGPECPDPKVEQSLARTLQWWDLNYTCNLSGFKPGARPELYYQRDLGNGITVGLAHEAQWVQGHFGFTLPSNEIPAGDEDYNDMARRLVVIAPQDTVQVAPNREQLQFSARTQRVIKEVYDAALMGGYDAWLPADASPIDKAKLRHLMKAGTKRHLHVKRPTGSAGTVYQARVTTPEKYQKRTRRHNAYTHQEHYLNINGELRSATMIFQPEDHRNVIVVHEAEVTETLVKKFLTSRSKAYDDPQRYIATVDGGLSARYNPPASLVVTFISPNALAAMPWLNCYEVVTDWTPGTIDPRLFASTQNPNRASYTRTSSGSVWRPALNLYKPGHWSEKPMSQHWTPVTGITQGLYIGIDAYVFRDRMFTDGVGLASAPSFDTVGDPETHSGTPWPPEAALTALPEMHTLYGCKQAELEKIGKKKGFTHLADYVQRRFAEDKLNPAELDALAFRLWLTDVALSDRTLWWDLPTLMTNLATVKGELGVIGKRWSALWQLGDSETCKAWYHACLALTAFVRRHGTQRCHLVANLKASNGKPVLDFSKGKLWATHYADATCAGHALFNFQSGHQFERDLVTIQTRVPHINESLQLGRLWMRGKPSVDSHTWTGPSLAFARDNNLLESDRRSATLWDMFQKKEYRNYLRTL